MIRLALLFLLAMSKTYEETDTDENEIIYEEEEDSWYGPGFYRGFWFYSEDDYRHGNHHYHDGGHHGGGGRHHGGGGHHK